MKILLSDLRTGDVIPVTAVIRLNPKGRRDVSFYGHRNYDLWPKIKFIPDDTSPIATPLEIEIGGKNTTHCRMYFATAYKEHAPKVKMWHKRVFYRDFSDGHIWNRMPFPMNFHADEYTTKYTAEIEWKGDSIRGEATNLIIEWEE
jgi:hypothetical protein